MRTQNNPTRLQIVNSIDCRLINKTTSKMISSSPNNYNTSLPTRFLLGVVLASCIFSCGLGILARNVILERILASVLETHNEIASLLEKKSLEFLPAPTVKGDKIVPRTIYTTMNFDTRSSVISSQWLQNDRVAPHQHPDDVLMAPENVKLIPINNGTEDYEYHADEEEHLPAGQHLLIDIDGVDGTFLNSEKQLATAMLQMVDNSGLTLLSYHCHGLQPAGVTCVGVLLESHVSFHTWPEEGVITLDLFTCGSTSLLNHLHLIQDLFAVPHQGETNPETPKVVWAYKRRGFNEQKGNTGSRDTFAYPLGIHGIEKEEIASIVTDQGKQGWVYDIERSTKGTIYADGSSSRFFYLDGVLKESSESGPASHETFVHPSMLAHKNPKRVLVFGSTTGATVKELLKHRSVQDVALVGVDKAILAFAKEKLQYWNDCSDIVSVEENCLDDTRVKAIYENPNMWLHNNSHLSSLDKASSLFDIVLVDYHELEEEVALDIINRNRYFLSGLKRILQENGILVLNVASDFRAVDSQSTRHAMSGQEDPMSLRRIRQNLEELGFVDVKQYDETQSGFPGSKNFIVAFRDKETAKNWNRNEAQVNRMIRERFVEMKSGTPPVQFFDGPKMVSYSKFVQHVDDDCAELPDPRWCDVQRQLVASELRSEHVIGEIRTLESIILRNTSEATNLSRQQEASQCELSEGSEEQGSLVCNPPEYGHFVGREQS